MSEVFKNYIDGKWLPGQAGQVIENRNPANRDDLIGLFPASDHDDVDTAVAAAKKAFASWRLVPAPKRGELLYRVGELLKAHKEEIARIMTREMGKVLKETRGDVQEGIDTAFYVAGEGRRLFGETTPSELPDKFAMSVRAPVGVCALITPWNFPMAIPTWKMFPALICGNTVVLKPAEDTPYTAVKLCEILQRAGVPSGVVNLVQGRGEEVGAALVRHPDVQLVSFTGSAEVGREVAAACGQSLKRVSLELGGKNAQIVMEDADLGLAVEGALWGAFGTTGQRCTATSRLILHREIALPARQAVLVWSAVGCRRNGEIPVRRWRWCGPLEGGRFPRIVVHLLAALDAPEEIDDERNLRQAQTPSGDRDRCVPFEPSQAPDFFARERPALPAVVPAAVHAEHALKEHRQKDDVHAD